MNLYFTDFFNVGEDELEEYGAFNISLVVDLPLFVDPFLLFNSNNPKYQNLHGEIIDYLRYLRDLAVAGSLTDGRISNLFRFSEVKAELVWFQSVWK